MMYNSNFVVAVKVNGKILQEDKEKVYLPFQSEYSLLIKNLNSRRALVNVFIDGENHTPGGLVIDACREIELERSLNNGNMSAGNKFKFIERTTAVEENRGIKLEDGIVRVEYKFEETYSYARQKWPNNNEPWIYNKWPSDDTILRGINRVYCSNVTLNSPCAMSYSANENGITVPGSISEQKFEHAAWFPTENISHVIVLKLFGQKNATRVINPVTVKTKQQCVTCGKVNKVTNKFCSECGTSLQII